MNTEANKQIARTFLARADEGDFEAWRAMLDPDALASANGEVMGRDEFEGMVRGITEAFSNGRHHVERARWPKATWWPLV